jgi:hypothetical protein
MSLRAEHWVERQHPRDGQGQFAEKRAGKVAAVAEALPARRNKATRHAAQERAARTEHVPGPDRPRAAATPGARQAIEAGDKAKLKSHLQRTTGFTDEQTGMRAVVHKVQTGDEESTWGGVVKGEPGKARVEYDILDRDGRKVGYAHRTWNLNEPGGAAVYHTDFQLAPHVRGGGFAKRWNARVEDEYRASGVQRIKTNASGEGGGYAWARQGYQFADQRERAALGRAAVAKMEGLIAAHTGDFTVADLQKARALAAGTSATPAQWADLGGKRLMAGLSWQGVKPL